MTSKYRSPIYAIGIFLIAVVAVHMSFWIYITTQYTSFEASKEAYLNTFPTPLQNAFLLTAINIYLLGGSIIIFLQSMKVNYRKRLSAGLLVSAAFLSVWNIFSLM
ncbi:hypothetical protein R1T16_04420 [Flavobacterium sp. DG1-102-2]|uniref:hypothetical protein n=1 Tax=Flavobacterium sp. DG1-102-2 TaxID=3081663 RepID=UPI00294A263D|nr:hypothetical protein [Flavobacterium sp. DG1-102-2]MDV6167656.1 hypothetical protein [Flavobacterium sp. DG1-102-2]